MPTTVLGSQVYAFRKAAKPRKPTQAIIAPTFGEPSTDVYRNVASIANRIQEALTALAAPLTTPGMLDTLRRGNADEIVSGLDWVGFVQGLNLIQKPIQHTVSSFGRLELTPEAMRRPVRKAKSGEAGQVSFVLPTGQGALKSIFTDVDQRAIKISAQMTGTLIKAVTEQTRQVVREHVGTALQGDMTARQLAVKLRSAVPLLPKDAASVDAYQKAQFDRMVKEGTPATVAADQSAALADKLAAKKLRNRTNLIARTEVVTASNQGRYAAWQSAVSAGYADAQSVKQWVAASDACPECAALDGEIVRWDDPFSTGDDMPPDHPACRCSAVMLPADQAPDGLALSGQGSADYGSAIQDVLGPSNSGDWSTVESALASVTSPEKAHAAGSMFDASAASTVDANLPTPEQVAAQAQAAAEAAAAQAAADEAKKILEAKTDAHLAAESHVADLQEKMGPKGAGISKSDVTLAHSKVDEEAAAGGLTPAEAKEHHDAIDALIEKSPVSKLGLSMAETKGVKLLGKDGHVSPATALAYKEAAAKYAALVAANAAKAEQKAILDGFAGQLDAGATMDHYAEAYQKLTDSGLGDAEAKKQLADVLSGKGLNTTKLLNAKIDGVPVMTGASLKGAYGVKGLSGKAAEAVDAVEQQVLKGPVDLSAVAVAKTKIDKIPGLSAAKKALAKEHLDAMLTHHGVDVHLPLDAKAVDLQKLELDFQNGKIDQAAYAKAQDAIGNGVPYVDATTKAAITIPGGLTPYSNSIILKLHTHQPVTQTEFNNAKTQALKAGADGQSKMLAALKDGGFTHVSDLPLTKPDPALDLQSTVAIDLTDPLKAADELYAIFVDGGVPSKTEYTAVYNKLSTVYSDPGKANAVKSMLVGALNDAGYTTATLPATRIAASDKAAASAAHFTGSASRSAFRAKMSVVPSAFSAEDKYGIQWYTHGVSYTMSKALRAGSTAWSSFGHHIEAARVFKAIGDLMARSVTGTDAVVFRGVTADAFDYGSPGLKQAFLGKDPAALVGKIITDKAYMSTSMTADVLPGFRGNATLEILVPKGSHAVYAADHSSYKSEMELLLNRDSKMQITSAVKVGSRWHIKVTLLQ